MVKICDTWQNFARGFTPGQDYKLRCSEELLKSLAEAVNTLIAQHLPDIPRYTKQPTDPAEARNVKAGIALEDLINAGVTILFEAPDEFSAWQKLARSLIA
jgi:hypothetical protein